jgi:hypothetical protein
LQIFSCRSFRTIQANNGKLPCSASPARNFKVISVSFRYDNQVARAFWVLAADIQPPLPHGAVKADRDELLVQLRLQQIFLVILTALRYND